MTSPGEAISLHRETAQREQRQECLTDLLDVAANYGNAANPSKHSVTIDRAKQAFRVKVRRDEIGIHMTRPTWTHLWIKTKGKKRCDY